jgi:serine/threonine protein phosphatase PrpC
MAAFPVVPELPEFHVAVVGRTDRGLVRSHNEDAFIVADLTGGALLQESPVARYEVGVHGVLLAVADGMGGARAGEIASAMALETLRRSLDQAVEHASPNAEVVSNAVQTAHRMVLQAAHDAGQSGASQMGATLTAAYVYGGFAYIAEVGDSRAYLLRGGVLTQLTKDQSLVQQLLDSGAITKAQADESPFKNVILQAMGHQDAVDVALARLALRDRDCIVLCSDGLTNVVTDDEMRATILSARSLDAAADKLVEIANERGGPDNITVVLAGIGGALAQSRPGERIEETFEVLKEYEPRSSRKPQKPH